jgi:hypothetical protein
MRNLTLQCVVLSVLLVPRAWAIQAAGPLSSLPLRTEELWSGSVSANEMFPVLGVDIAKSSNSPALLPRQQRTCPPGQIFVSLLWRRFAPNDSFFVANQANALAFKVFRRLYPTRLLLLPWRDRRMPCGRQMLRAQHVRGTRRFMLRAVLLPCKRKVLRGRRLRFQD